MKTGIFARSFDPFTLGHLYITKVASNAFDKVIICIATNPEKQRTFSKELMKKGIEDTLKENTSSTKVRELLKQNKPISDYVPKSIETLIAKK